MQSFSEIKPKPKKENEKQTQQNLTLIKQVDFSDNEFSIKSLSHGCCLIKPLANGIAFMNQKQLMIYDNETQNIIHKKINVPFLSQMSIWQIGNGKILFSIFPPIRIAAFSLNQVENEQKVEGPILLDINHALRLLNKTEFVCYGINSIGDLSLDIYNVNNLNNPVTSLKILRNEIGSLPHLITLSENTFAICPFKKSVVFIYQRKEQKLHLVDKIDLRSHELKDVPKWANYNILVKGSLNNYLLTIESIRKKSYQGMNLVTQISIWELSKECKLTKTHYLHIKDTRIQDIQHFSYGPGDIRLIYCIDDELHIFHPDIKKPKIIVPIEKNLMRCCVVDDKKILLVHKTNKGCQIRVMEYNPQSVKEKVKDTVLDKTPLPLPISRIVSNYVHDDVQMLEAHGDSVENTSDFRP